MQVFLKTLYSYIIILHVNTLKNNFIVINKLFVSQNLKIKNKWRLVFYILRNNQIF